MKMVRLNSGKVVNCCRKQIAQTSQEIFFNPRKKDKGYFRGNTYDGCNQLTHRQIESSSRELKHRPLATCVSHEQQLESNVSFSAHLDVITSIIATHMGHQNKSYKACGGEQKNTHTRQHRHYSTSG